MDQIAHIGKYAINELFPIIKQYNTKHIFLVRGKNSFFTSGADKVINDCVSKLDCRLTHFYDFSENPKIEDVQIGLELLSRSGADCIVAIGGGSVLDMGKLIRFSYSYKGDLTGNIFDRKKNLLPLVAIPTTAGTGAEATHFAVVYKDNVKYSAEHDDILPDYALVYPPLTYNNPKYLTSCSGFDALAQAIEAFWNLNATEESDRYAEKAIKLLWNNLPTVVNNPTNELRDIIAEGSYWAGRAINITKTTAPHAFSYPFTTYYGYPHGHAVALTFPLFANLNICNYEKYFKGDTHNYANKMRHLMELLNIRKGECKSTFINYLNLIGLNNKSQNIDIGLIVRSVNLKRLSNNPISIVDNKEILNGLIL